MWIYCAERAPQAFTPALTPNRYRRWVAYRELPGLLLLLCAAAPMHHSGFRKKAEKKEGDNTRVPDTLYVHVSAKSSCSPWHAAIDAIFLFRDLRQTIPSVSTTPPHPPFCHGCWLHRCARSSFSYFCPPSLRKLIFKLTKFLILMSSLTTHTHTHQNAMWNITTHTQAQRDTFQLEKYYPTQRKSQ